MGEELPARVQLLKIVTDIVSSRDGTGEYAGECADRILDAILRSELLDQAVREQTHSLSEALSSVAVVI